MNTKHIDTYIFLKDNLEQDKPMNVLHALRNMSGINSAGPHPKINNLVEVNYNPHDTSCSHIVNTIKNSGYNSVWIGM